MQPERENKSPQPTKPLSERAKIAIITALITLAGTGLTVTGSIVAAKSTASKEGKSAVSQELTSKNSEVSDLAARTTEANSKATAASKAAELASKDAATAKQALEEANVQIRSANSNIGKLEQAIKEAQFKMEAPNIPAGMIMAFAGQLGTNETAQLKTNGSLLCDGHVESRTEFASLFKAIGISWGGGDGITNFNVPDLRGVFLRGVNGDRSDSFKDPEVENRIAVNGSSAKNAVGSFQTDAVGPHTHTFLAWNSKALNNGPTIARTHDHDTQVELRTDKNEGHETHPKNAYVHYIIKY